LIIKKDRSLHAGETELRMSSLRSKLEAIFTTRKNKQVYIQADRAVDYGTVAEAMGEIRAAGIFSIGMITLPKVMAK
ncbi:MAG: ExbD/TolR family protein, partial [Bdellovibrionales bacterium]